MINLLKTLPLTVLAVMSSAAFSKPLQVMEIDATSYEDKIYFTYDDDQMVVSDESRWILSVKRTQFQTNSGTSGELEYGAYNTKSTDFESIQSCDYGDLSYDEILPVPGPPGSGDFSGNPVINDWFNYEFATHKVTSKKHVYLVTNEEHCFKLQILSYKRGLFKVKAQALEL